MESTTSFTFPVQNLLLPLSGWHRHQVEGTDCFYCLLRKALSKRGKRNFQSSEAKLPQRDSNPRPPGRHSNAPTHSAPARPETFVTNDIVDAHNYRMLTPPNCFAIKKSVQYGAAVSQGFYRISLSKFNFTSLVTYT